MSNLAEQRDETMLYRKPTKETDENAVSEIWGHRLETRVVDASEVPSLLSEGWVEHPMDLTGERKPEVKAAKADNSEPVATKEALATAEQLIAKLTDENGKLIADLKAAEELAEAETKAKDALQAELDKVRKGK